MNNHEKEHAWLRERIAALETALGLSPIPTSPPAGGRWDDALIERAIRTSTGKNEGLIANVDNGKPGWRSGAAVVMGSRWSYQEAPGWWPRPTAGVPFWWPYFVLWGVLFTEQGNPTNDGWVDVKGMDVQIKYSNDDNWHRLGGSTDDIDWIANYKEDMITELPSKPDMRPGLDGGTSIRMPRTGAPHFTWGNKLRLVGDVPDIEAVMTRLKVRLDPRGDQRLLALAQVGGDPKPGADGKPSTYGLPYFVGFGASAAMRVTKDWQEVIMINLAGAQTEWLGDVISIDRLRAMRPFV